MPGVSRRTAFVGRRVASTVAVLFGVVVVTFALMHLAPGGPWNESSALAGANAQQLTEAEVHNLKVHYGLQRPLPSQLLLYMRNLAGFDFGQSYRYEGQSVRSLVLRSWSYTAVLGAVSFCVSVVGGIGLGVATARRHRSALDRLVTGFAGLAASVPSFLVGILLVVVFSVGLRRVTGGAFYLPDGGFGLDGHLLLPVIAMSLLPMAFIARLTRASVLDTMAQDHVRAARAKGLLERVVVRRHVLRNAMNPVVAAAGPMLAYLLAGSVVVESLFQIPGLGRLFVDAVATRDYPTIMGTTVLFALVVAVANLAADLANMRLDPRIEPG